MHFGGSVSCVANGELPNPWRRELKITAGIVEYLGMEQQSRPNGPAREARPLLADEAAPAFKNARRKRLPAAGVARKSESAR